MNREQNELGAGGRESVASNGGDVLALDPTTASVTSRTPDIATVWWLLEKKKKPPGPDVLLEVKTGAKRLKAGARVWGDRSFARSPMALIQTVREELLGVCAWSSDGEEFATTSSSRTVSLSDASPRTPGPQGRAPKQSSKPQGASGRRRAGRTADSLAYAFRSGRRTDGKKLP